MAQVIALLQRIVSILSTVLSVIGVIQGQTSKAAQENVPFSIDTNVSITKEVVTDAVIGNANIFAALGDIESILAANQVALLAAIADAQQTGSPVTLPTTPPSGYGDTANAHDIWAYVGPGESLSMGQFQSQAGANAIFESTGGILKPSQFYPGWQVTGNWDESGSSDPNGGFLDDIDVNTILSTDATIQDWWNRLYSAASYFFDSQGHPGAHQIGSLWFWQFWMGTVEFLEFKAAKFGTVAPSSATPPIWPGIANVTFLGSFDIAPQLTLEMPMDGVIVHIDAVTANKPTLPYDTQMAYKFIGALAFVDDNADTEPFQALAFARALYCPLQMNRAGAVVVRADPAVVGTITPWVIT